jgi:hypothetical protein
MSATFLISSLPRKFKLLVTSIKQLQKLKGYQFDSPFFVALHL